MHISLLHDSAVTVDNAHMFMPCQSVVIICSQSVMSNTIEEHFRMRVECQVNLMMSAIP